MSKTQGNLDHWLVVDADSHSTESLDDILEYTERGVRDIINGSSMPLNEVFSLTINSPAFPFIDDGYSIGGPGPASKLDEMEKFGIDFSIISPSIALSLNTVNNTQYATEIARATNSLIVNELLELSPKLKGHIVVAPQQPTKAAEEIEERATERDFVGVVIPATGLVPPPGHAMYEPIYAAAEKYDLVVSFHSAAPGTWKSFPVQYMWTETYAESHTLSHPQSLMWVLTSLVMNGIPEKFPDLRFSLSEAGIGWIPYITYRLDDHYLEHGHELPLLERLPSEYIEEQFHFTTQPLGHTPTSSSYVADMIKHIGTESVLFSADLPHSDFDTPEELFNRISSHFDEDQLRDIMGGTAAQLYDLK